MSLAAIKGSLQMRCDANCSSAKVAHDNKLIITTTAGQFFPYGLPGSAMNFDLRQIHKGRPIHRAQRYDITVPSELVSRICWQSTSSPSVGSRRQIVLISIVCSFGGFCSGIQWRPDEADGRTEELFPFPDVMATHRNRWSCLTFTCLTDRQFSQPMFKF